MSATASRSLLRRALVLGLISAVGPFAIDMYLPAMPVIGTDLGSSVTAMQASITAYFLAFGLAQLIYGPWADQSGRRLPMTVGLLIFVLGSLICAAAPSAEVLMTGRFVQGLGGAAVMVVPRAIIRDLYTGHEATRMMAAIMLVISVSPMLAPLAGAGLIAVADWRVIFLLLAGVAGLSLLLIRLVLPETLPPAERQPVSVAALAAGTRMLLTHGGFLALTFLGGFGMASFFVFIASAPFVYAEAYGMTPTQFSLAFAVNAIGFFAASQLAAGFGQRFGAMRVARAAATGFALATVFLFATALAGFAPLWLVMAGLFVANACLGLVIPTTMVLALEEHGEHAGLASSLGGTLQMLAGGVMIAVSAPFFDGSVVPMLGAIAVCGALAFLLARLAIRPGV